MNYTQFCGERVSTLGMGNMRLPTTDGNPVGKVDYEASSKMIEECFSRGINYFDTAYVYHGGDSERFLGEALSTHKRDTFYLATKFLVSANKDYKAVFAEQLSRLRTDYIDYYLIHSIQDNNASLYIDGGAIDYFLEQQRAGRVRHLGFSFHASLPILERYLSHHKWDFVQIQLNYLDYYFGSAKAEYELIKKAGLPIVVMEGVRGGALAKLPSEDKKTLCALHPEWSDAAWALRWVKSLPGVAVVLSGMHDTEQIKDNCKTFSDPVLMSDADCKAIQSVAEHLHSTITVPCTSCRYCTPTCPQGLDIPALLSIFNEHEYSLDWLKPSIAQKFNDFPADKRASSCVSCGECTTHCPQSIDIPCVMQKIAALEPKG